MKNSKKVKYWQKQARKWEKQATQNNQLCMQVSEKAGKLAESVEKFKAFCKYCQDCEPDIVARFEHHWEARKSSATSTSMVTYLINRNW